MFVQWFNTARLCVFACCVAVAMPVTAFANIETEAEPEWSLPNTQVSTVFARVSTELVRPVARSDRFEPRKLIVNMELAPERDQPVSLSEAANILPEPTDDLILTVAASEQSFVSRSAVVKTQPVRIGAFITWPILLLIAGTGFLVWTGKRRRQAQARVSMLHTTLQ